MRYELFWPYLLVMAATTYLTRVIPLALFRRRIRSRFVRSFLMYVPYAVLAAMTLPGVLYATGSIWTAAAGLIAAVVLAWREKPLLTVAMCASLMVLVAQWALGMM
ncbi:MAG: AzlD domain-containing protein [Christensenellaceae bacterium]|nr:AzlD domain-containing protein [Christensenellaceae bacterium]MEA5067279.1 AzlD domain-containing protein [Eubacteriales bacterium]MEA5068249.1 AzlD domain-containing protein [Christensenellaceae bacterium]